MIFPPHIEKKYNFILTFALATPFLRPRDPPGVPTPRLGNPGITQGMLKFNAISISYFSINMASQFTRLLLHSFKWKNITTSCPLQYWLWNGAESNMCQLFSQPGSIQSLILTKKCTPMDGVLLSVHDNQSWSNASDPGTSFTPPVPYCVGLVEQLIMSYLYLDTVISSEQQDTISHTERLT